MTTGKIAADAITYAKLQNVSATNRLLGRSTSGAGDVEEIGLVGDVTVAGNIATIANDAVTFAKMQNLSGSTRFVGRFSTGAGDAEDLSGASATQMLSAVTSAAQGVAPASGGGTTNFLRADITWAAPPGGGGADADITRISGNSGVAGNTITWQVLTGSSTTSGVTPGIVMTTSGVGSGTWRFNYLLRFGTSATTTGVKFNVNHTNTTTNFASAWRYVDSGAAASTGVADDITGQAETWNSNSPVRLLEAQRQSTQTQS